MKAKDVSAKLDEYKKLKALAKNIEDVLSDIEKAEKKEKSLMLTPFPITLSWLSIENESQCTNISMNSDVTSEIKNDIKNALIARLAEINKKMSAIEI